MDISNGSVYTGERGQHPGIKNKTEHRRKGGERKEKQNMKNREIMNIEELQQVNGGAVKLNVDMNKKDLSLTKGLNLSLNLASRLD